MMGKPMTRPGETTGAVKRAAAEVRDEMPACGLCSDDRCTPCMDDAERYARAALTAALEDVDAMARVVHREICEGNIVDCREWGGQCVDAVVAVVAHLVGGAV